VANFTLRIINPQEEPQ